ncbi:MAG: hypothetical protein ABFS56_19315 [Pseudomonadota bacterium]
MLKHNIVWASCTAIVTQNRPAIKWYRGTTDEEIALAQHDSVLRYDKVYRDDRN